MKKNILGFIIALIIIFPLNIDAKTVKRTCSYTGPYTYTKKGQEVTENITIDCQYYNNDSGQCRISESSFGQSISNWGKHSSFNAKEYYKNNQKCFDYMVFLNKEALFDKYEVFAADSYSTAVSLASAEQSRNPDKYHTAIIPLVSSSDGDVEENTELEELYNKIDSYIALLDKMNTANDPWKLNECLDEKGNMNPNATNYYICIDRLQAFYNEVNAWEQEIRDAIDSGLIDSEDAKVKSFQAAVRKARGNVNSTTDDGLYDGELEEEYDPTIGFSTGKLECSGIFGGRFGAFLKKLYNLMKFAVPILIIALAIIDFLKATASQDQAEIKKAANKLVKRLVIGTLIFVIPTILEFILGVALGIEDGLCGIG